MLRIYNKEKIPKEIFTVNLNKEEIEIVLGGDIFMDHPKLKKNEHIVLEREIPFINPILENEEIREMTREEQIIVLGNTNLLLNGEYINKDKILKKEIPENLISPVWNKEKKKWEEGADLEEQKIVYKNKIDGYKAEILEKGFVFERHHQKCRDKDLALLSNAIAALEDAGATEGLVWAFSDSDLAKMSLEQLKQMRISGMNFITTVYEVEAYLKRGEIISDLTVEKFREKVNENSEVKAV